ncbi:MAG: HVO_A0114 family putative DNA-binding protein [Sulfuricaulis sp.]
MKRVVTVRVERLDEGLESFRRAWKSRRHQGEFVTFERLSDMARTLTPTRFELLRLLQAKEPLAVRALAQMLKRNMKNMHRDVKPLTELGLIESGEQGLFVPYDEIRAEFTLRRNAA